MKRFGSRRGRLRRVAVPLIVGMVALGTPRVGGTGHAWADSGCGDGTVSISGTTVTCTFLYIGKVQTFAVPDGVTSVHIEAIGAGGGTGGGGISGGLGHDVQATISGLTSGSSLYVEVGGGGGGGTGGSTSGTSGGGSGGFNGGGSGGIADGGGGGGDGGGGRRGDVGQRLRVVVDVDEFVALGRHDANALLAEWQRRRRRECGRAGRREGRGGRWRLVE
jgi:hypothetical protein